MPNHRYRILNGVQVCERCGEVKAKHMKQCLTDDEIRKLSLEKSEDKWNKRRKEVGFCDKCGESWLDHARCFQCQQYICPVNLPTDITELYCTTCQLRTEKASEMISKSKNQQRRADNDN